MLSFSTLPLYWAPGVRHIIESYQSYPYAFVCISMIGCAVVGVLIVIQRQWAMSGAPPSAPRPT